LEIEGVEAAVPVIRYISPSLKGRWGIQQLDGVDWKPFSDMNIIAITEGRAPETNDEVVVDQRQMRTDKIALNDTITLFGDRSYKVVGVFSPPSGSRIKMSLAAMQDALESPGKCTYILVKLKNDADVEAVARTINEKLPGNKINLTRDLVIDAQERVPMLKTFLRVLVLLGAFVSVVFVLLSMYTTITERRKEIGILKSLGASKTLIIATIEGEALFIGALGIILGLVVAVAASGIIERGFELPFEFSSGWFVTAILIAIFGSMIGALYPAWRASDIDPVEVMLNE